MWRRIGVGLALAFSGLALLPGGTSGQSAEAFVEMRDLAFQPAEITVAVGTRLTWTNQDTFEHTVTFESGQWDSDLVDLGGRFALIFNEPGAYAYYCQPHGGPGGAGMSGTIIVVESPPDEPPPAPVDGEEQPDPLGEPAIG